MHFVTFNQFLRIPEIIFQNESSLIAFHYNPFNFCYNYHIIVLVKAQGKHGLFGEITLRLPFPRTIFFRSWAIRPEGIRRFLRNHVNKEDALSQSIYYYNNSKHCLVKR